MADDMPQHRYDAETADELETRWQAQWLADGTHHAPNPAGQLADEERAAPAQRLIWPAKLRLYGQRDDAEQRRGEVNEAVDGVECRNVHVDWRQ